MPMFSKDFNCSTTTCIHKNFMKTARAARRFCKMEQAEKIKKHNKFMKNCYKNRAKLRDEIKVNGKWI